MRDVGHRYSDVQTLNIERRQSKQLMRGYYRRNRAIVDITASCGDEELDCRVLEETREETARGRAEGPFVLSEGADIMEVTVATTAKNHSDR